MKYLFTLFIVAAVTTTSFGNSKGLVYENALQHYDTVSADTIQAVKHLFKRKKIGGAVRTAVFASLTGLSIASGITSGLAGNYLIAAVTGGIMITGISQTKKYSQERLEVLLKDLGEGKPLPDRIKKKLKKKDFVR